MDKAARFTPEAMFPAEGSGFWKPDFLIGTATASYQIEGAVHEDGRIPSIWDTYSHTPGLVLNGDNGDVACDHYHRWESDFDLISGLGLDAYRLSIAWPRVMDEKGRPNQKGLDFYKRLLDTLEARGVQRFVTLYHWDLPQHIQDRGGWVSRESVYRFAEYTELVSRELAGRVTAWSTLNEPWCSAFLGHCVGRHAPGSKNLRHAVQALHHLLLGHGMAVDVLRANDPGALVGIVCNVGHARANTDSPADRRAAELFEIQHNAWLFDPMFKGQYPSALFDELWPGADPLVLAGDMEKIATKIDYMGINYYFRSNIESDGAHGFREVLLPSVERTQMGWEVYPDGLRDLLIGFKRDYPNFPPVYITENGMASPDEVVDGEVDDAQRVSYLKRHWDAVDQAMKAGVDVRGYFIWSLLDNFEWAYGYERRFGIFHVDYKTQVRTAKNSAKAVKAFLQARRK
jgi:beta-glucosidase